MDLQTIRAQLLAERERRYASASNQSKWTQDAVAKRAGVEQSVLSKIEKLEKPMTELRARVLLNIIEKGLQLPLSEFFGEIERRSQSSSLTAAPRAAQSEESASSTGAPHGDQVSPSLDDDLLERFARAFIKEARKQERRVEPREHVAGDRPHRPGRRPATRKVR